MKNYVLLAVILVAIFKLPFLLTHHVQEDAYITWRVAQNILDFGVIGFNGEEKISSSTTHLYTFVSLIFYFLFGKENFITPILIFNILLFGLGSYFLARIFFKNSTKQILFIIAINVIPPALKASYLGMEYAIIFFLIGAFLFYAIYLGKQWAFWVFPILLLWTRLDAAVFLGVSFLVYSYINFYWNWNFVLAGAIGFLSVLLFNYLYFGDWINHTIIAKSIAYQDLKLEFMRGLHEAMLYLGIVKTYNWSILIPAIALLLGSLYFFRKIRLKAKPLKIVLGILFFFSVIKWILFRFLLANFDWYYWIPQIFLYSIVLIGLLQLHYKKRTILLYTIFIMIPLLCYSIVHSIATGNGEWNHRAKIGKYFHEIEPDKTQSILLEPAGYIPFYSNLKTIDEVGLVHKGVTEEMKLDFDNWWFNTIEKHKPKYILSLSFAKKRITKDQYAIFKTKYQYIKTFKIEDALESENPILEKIYTLKPSGRNYHYYKRIQKNGDFKTN